MEGGSAVKDDRSGGAPGLHKRGFASAEDRGGGRRGRAAPILDGTGDSPPVFVFHTRGREGAIAVRRTAAKRSPEALGRPDGGRAQSIRQMDVMRLRETVNTFVTGKLFVDFTGKRHYV